VPKLACYGCGRQVYTVVGLESLFGDEQRCPRCGALLDHERRDIVRRQWHRRQNPPNDPGPPADSPERRVAERRTWRRRETDRGW
jgi:DNA-directed RNA polymerase subunit RPC12/RpoP